MSAPYAGNPYSFPAAVNTLSGSDAPSSTSINTAPEGALDRTAWLYATGAGIIAQTWKSEFAATAIRSSCGLGALSWDPLRRVWVSTVADSSGNVITYTSLGVDDGNLWTAVGGSPAVAFGSNALIIANSADPTTADQYWWIAANGTTVKVYNYTGSWSASRSLTAAQAVTGAGMLAFAGVLIYGLAENTSSNSPLSSWNGTSWSDFSAGWGLGANAIYLKSNGSMVVAMSSANAFSGAPYYTSTDGIHWTSRTSPITTSEQISGLTWNGTAWYAAIYNTSTSYVRFVTSLDGISWSTISPAPLTSGLHVTSLASVGALLVASLAEGSNDQSATASKAIFSLDNAQTWRPTQATLFQNAASGSTSVYAMPEVIASDVQFALFNTDYCRMSAIGGSGAPAL